MKNNRTRRLAFIIHIQIDLLVLRGDKAKDENIFKPVKDGYSHALELEQQINDFNSGKFVDGSLLSIHHIRQ